MVDDERLSVYAAVARVTYRLALGESMTTQEVAVAMSRSRTTAHRLMTELEGSHHVPVYFDTTLGAWKLLMEKR